MGITEFFETHKKGSFHSNLGINKGDKIPIDLLERIKNAHIGEVIFNPYSITKDKKYIKVTELMQKKARFLYNMRNAKRHRENNPTESFGGVF
jgi:hypothetical protein